LTRIETSAISQRELIVDVAAQLFIENGYVATSVRQIAEHVGCTEAAMYYHFKDGKHELFQAIPEKNISDLMNALEASRGAPSQHDFITRYGPD
jgi:AcrR family transcriptional regulator